jgi:hypothetical protein
VSKFCIIQPEEMEIYCHAFVLYCAIKLKDDLSKEDDKQGRVRLSDILRATNLKLVPLFSLQYLSNTVV